MADTPRLCSNCTASEADHDAPDIFACENCDEYVSSDCSVTGVFEEESLNVCPACVEPSPRSENP